MPKVEQQKIAKVSRPAVNGSLLSRAVLIEDLPVAPLKLLVYGGNRTGKTTLACQFPKPLLLLSWEPAMSGGAESVRREKGVHYLHVVPDGNDLLRKRKGNDAILSEREAVGLAREIASNKALFSTIVFDGATSCQDVVLANLLDLPSLPDQLGWGTVGSDQYRERSEKTREVLRAFLDLPVDTIILAKEKDHNPPREEKVNERTGKVSPDMRPAFLRGMQDKSFVAAELGGTTTGWLQDCCDWVCRLFVQEEEEVKETKMAGGKTVKRVVPTGRYVRYLRMGYHPNFSAGPRSSTPGKVPDVLAAPTYAKIIKIIRGE